jgi:ABC-type lipoprotein release transport system permease subunit
MLVSMAWRNLARNLRRSVLTGAAVALGIFLITWMRGLQDGSYDQMIDQAVRTRLGHVQVLPRGYLDRPEPAKVIPDGLSLARRLSELDHVRAVSPRAIAEGMAARDNESAPVDLLGVDPSSEQRASVVPDRLLRGDDAERWCRDQLSDALELMGGDDELFGRWCAATRASRYLAEDDARAVVLGVGLAKQLLVGVGDEVTVQVVRAVAADGAERGEGGEAGALSQRRLEVVGLVRTGNPEVDDQVAYVPLDVLTAMLGTDGPNELVILLDDLDNLEEVRAAAAGVVGPDSPSEVTAWYQRNPALRSLIEVDSRSGALVYVILFVLVALGVINTTLMSVLERTHEFGVMLALGARRGMVFSLVMTEVALLGVISLVVGCSLGALIEAFGRVHGWPLEWFGYDAEAMGDASMAGVVYDPIYYANLTTTNAIVIVVGVYAMFLFAGLLPAIRAARLAPVDAMRRR